MNISIILYGDQKLDKFVYNIKKFTAEEKAAIISNADLSWNDFPNANLLCNYSSASSTALPDITSSFVSGIGSVINQFEIQRKRADEGFYKTVGTFTVEELNQAITSGDYYSVIDYVNGSNFEYTYRIFPVTENKMESFYEGKIITQWDDFFLAPIKKVPNKTNEWNFVLDDNGEFQYWNFGVDCQEGAIQQNTDKTIFQTFTEKPKISIGQQSYTTGSLTAKLGSISESGRYYEPNEMINKWESFVAKGDLCLYKNPKGDCKIISIDSGSSRTISNEIANYYVDSSSGTMKIVNRPTTLSFFYTEIGEIDDAVISRIG